MADNPRIHPVHHDPEAQQQQPQSPTVPLVSRDTSRSDKGDPNRNRTPPFPQRTIPVNHSKPPKRRRGCCCRFFCWTISLILILVLVIGITLGILYLVFRPKLPKYSVDALRITQFNVSDDMNSLNATFNVNITARNPNKKIGIYYEGGSTIDVWYTDTKLCKGSLPKFYQGHRNTTVMDVVLTGQTQNATGLLTTLQAERQATGTIPLNLKVKVPVRIKLGKLKLFKVKFRVRCKLVVDNLSANSAISIKNSSCKFRLRL